MINVQALTKFYGDLCAVDGVNFEIKKGEVLGLLGPNGAGKTTIMRILTCYLSATSGTIKVKDLDIEKDSLAVKRLMGYLPESAPLYPDMLVYDYLNYVADVRELDEQKKGDRILYLAKICGIREVMHQPIGQLSKGYNQRVGLAQAMMGDPEILVLDEPTSGLDPNQIIEIREIIKEIGKQKTIILSTHILSEAEATCDRVVIINRGKIVADGKIDQLEAEMARESYINLTLSGAQFKDVKGKLASINGVTAVQQNRISDGLLDVQLICKSEKDIRAQIYSAIKSEDWLLLEFHKRIKSLENIFRELTKEN